MAQGPHKLFEFNAARVAKAEQFIDIELNKEHPELPAGAGEEAMIGDKHPVFLKKSKFCEVRLPGLLAPSESHALKQSYEKAGWARVDVRTSLDGTQTVVKLSVAF